MPRFKMEQFRQQIRGILDEQPTEALPLVEKILKKNGSKLPKLPRLPKV